MAEIKTCEEYVLSELSEANKKIDELTEDNKKIIAQSNQRFDDFNKTIEYANKVIGLLAQMIQIQKLKSKGKFKIVHIIKDDINLDLANENEEYIFNILAPVIGDAATKEAFKKEQEKIEEAKKEETVEEK